MDVKTKCEISYCDWRDIELKIKELSGISVDTEKQMKNIKRLIDQQVQVAFNAGVEHSETIMNK